MSNVTRIGPLSRRRVLIEWCIAVARDPQKIAHEEYGTRTPAIKRVLMVFPVRGMVMVISSGNEVEQHVQGAKQEVGRTLEKT
ncbi:hypothetical protein EVAR_53325_1 [Eumeta japonica]|uniref:Uncharacterized protein n=1 Tax=Eumeta variegata TaxID=151549 RepID=A0A4C1X5Y4_EUMVA|nr:hypothetical protein EVAR_53325_1 [Eumeta japonica]